MNAVLLSGAAVLGVLGIGNHVYWLGAAALLHVYLKHGRSKDAKAGPPPAGGTPGTYQAYRERRDRQARWERRYRRERPFESRRQQRERTGR
ncbi:hypothetical protein [Streptomyces sp. NPDC006997]|uniref:hypothetical protein n=1 Tax=Streptomyces sp. NPDC006997 TaxID=3155356 RepID=UPI0033FF70FE